MENQPRQEPATPEEIWKILRRVSEEREELSLRMKENDRQIQENERLLKEQIQENDRLLKESKQKADRETEELKKLMQESKQKADRETEELKKQVQETSREVKATARQLKKTDAHFNSQWGKLMESLVEGDLVSLLKKRNIKVERTSTNAKGPRNGHHYEFDILAVNGKEVVVVEVKTTLRPEDVTYFLKKLNDYTTWAPEHKGKQILGAVAYLKADSSVTTYAERQGLYIIRATGSSASITNEEGFRPKVFH